eukprot:scaffold19869_cov136-Skeletonema_dohrnii-CCMP3373.AAC.3
MQLYYSFLSPSPAIIRQLIPMRSDKTGKTAVRSNETGNETKFCELLPPANPLKKGNLVKLGAGGRNLAFAKC